MGMMNLRAICPNCGGKIHTQPKGLGHFTWMRSWFLVQTGTTCQHCGVALSGRVKADNKAELASAAAARGRPTARGVAREPRRAAPAGPACASCGHAPEPRPGGWVRCPNCGALF
jgi:DNA-directed RNA polymerase subunit RPC12/RpoP